MGKKKVGYGEMLGVNVRKTTKYCVTVILYGLSPPLTTHYGMVRVNKSVVNTLSLAKYVTSHYMAPSARPTQDRLH